MISNPSADAGGICLIEDYNAVRWSEPIKKVLQTNGYRFHSTKSLVHVNDTVRDLKPDIVLMDGSSHESIDLCYKFKQDKKLPLLYVIMVVARTPDVSWAGFDAQVDDFIVQPFTAQDLLARIRLAMRNRNRNAILLGQNRSMEKKLAEHNEALLNALHRSQALAIMKDYIVSNVSHELRTPLLQVKSAVSLLAEELTAGERTSLLINYAAQATARLESVAHGITQLANAFDVKLETIRIVDAISIAERDLKRRWASATQMDRVRIADNFDKLPLVKGDVNGTAQVLQQLIDNALKYSEEIVDVYVKREGTRVRIAIQDRGVGISPEQRERIFTSTPRNEDGSFKTFGIGCGLAIVRLILDAMHTQLELDSEAGEGSTFSFTLPIVRA